MKTKKFNKKLTLNKATISNLGNSQMNDVYAGLQTKTVDVCCTLGTLCVPWCPERTKDPSVIPHVCCF